MSIYESFIFQDIQSLSDQGGSSQYRADKAHETSAIGDKETFDAFEIFSNIIEKDLGDIWNCFSVLGDIELICPRQLQTTNHASHNYIDVHKCSVSMGLRLLFHHFFRIILSSFNIVPMQLTPNEWGYIVESFWNIACMKGDRLLDFFFPFTIW